MQGWLKGQSHILKTATMVPRKRLSQGDCSYILTPRATGAARPSPAGPESKKFSLPKTLGDNYSFVYIYIYIHKYILYKMYGFLKVHAIKASW